MSKLTNRYALHKLYPFLKKINALQEKMASLSDDDLQKQMHIFKEEVHSGTSLDALLVPVYACVREAAKRILGMFPYDEQVLAAIALHQGHIIEMKTGEGKTLVATMPLALNALSGKSTILVTSNDYLAKRDATEMGRLYHFLGFTVGIGVPEDASQQLSAEEKKIIYSRDIVYTTHGVLAFDYLLENLVTRKEERYLRSFSYIVIDEVDSVLLDAATMPLVISGAPRVQSNLYESADYFVSSLRKDIDYKLEDREVFLTEKGLDAAERFFGVENLYQQEYFEILRHIMLSLRAHTLFLKDRDYVVGDHKVSLLDQRSGRIFESTKLKSGLHQAIEAKEHCPITDDARAMASITYQAFFRLFEKMSGMSGAVYNERQELKKVYNLDTIVIPTHKKIARIDAPDLYFGHKEAQVEAAAAFILKRHATGQPLLIVTSSIDDSYAYSRFLLAKGIPHNVLNAYNVAKEAEIIKEAGQKNAVTVATSVAGRGTDIRLGAGVQELGGLCVVGIGRQMNLRSEKQARGRAGRQGDPGYSQFFISIEDDVVDEYGSTKLSKYLKKNQITSSRIIRLINQAQINAETLERTSRREIMEYDRSLSAQRTLIYNMRNRLLDAPSLGIEDVKGLVDNCIDNFVSSSHQDVSRFVLDHLSYHYDGIFDTIKDPDELSKQLKDFAYRLLKQKQDFMQGEFNGYLKTTLLSAIDHLWVEQVDYLEQLRYAIALRQYAQRNIIYMFHQEAYDAFTVMMDKMKEQAVQNMMLGMVISNEADSFRVLLP